MALEAHQRAFAPVPRAVLEFVGIPRARGHLRTHAKVACQRLLATARGQLVDVVTQLPGGHSGPGVDHRQLPHSASGGVEPLPVQIPHHPPARISAQRRDRIQPVDRQLTQPPEGPCTRCPDAPAKTSGSRQRARAIHLPRPRGRRPSRPVQRALLASRPTGTGPGGQSLHPDRLIVRRRVFPRARPGAVEVNDGCGRRPVSVVQVRERVPAAPVRVSARPVIRRWRAAISILPGAHRFAHLVARPFGRDRAGMAACRGTTPARCPCGSFSDAALPNPA